MHVCIVGGGSAIGQAVILHYLDDDDARVTALCRKTFPSIDQFTVNVNGSIVEWTKDHSRYCCTSDHWTIEGKIDTLITLTGAVENAKIVNMTREQFQQGLTDNLTSVFDSFRWLLPRMNDGGSVVVVGSVVGSLGGYGCANYAAAKAGLLGLVRAAANEHPKLRINLLELGYVDAGMGARLPEELKDKIKATIPMKRFATLAEVAHAIDFLASQTYMTGNVLTFAGGLHGIS